LEGSVNRLIRRRCEPLANEFWLIGNSYGPAEQDSNRDRGTRRDDAVWIDGILVALPRGAVLAQDRAQDRAKIASGKVLYQQWCVSCHGVGPGHPGTQALDFRYKGALPAALEDRANLTPDFVKVVVRNGISVMPFFRKTEISDSELAEIGAYL